MKDCDLFTKHHLLDALRHPVAMRGRTSVPDHNQPPLPDIPFLELRLKSKRSHFWSHLYLPNPLSTSFQPVQTLSLHQVLHAQSSMLT